MTTKKQKPKLEPEPKVFTFETFRRIGAYEISDIKQEAPSCFNGNVSVKRYRVTIEEIEEPPEVICARIQKLWDECRNQHHRQPLQHAASEYGLELKFKH